MTKIRKAPPVISKITVMPGIDGKPAWAVSDWVLAG